jgi:hypothetical protein
VNPIPAKRTLLFRAHQHATTDQPGEYSSTAREVLFDDQFRQQKTVRDFLVSLGRHLGKTYIRTKTGKQLRTRFTSTSSKLNWTLHLTGKKLREQQEQGLADQVSLVIFDLQTLSRTPNVTVFQVSDVLRFLEASNEPDLIEPKYREWATNCDEYVIMGQNVQEGVVQVIPWSELRWMPIINDPFCSAYTLGTYRRFRDERMDGRPEIEYAQACQAVVDSAKAIAGQRSSDVQLVQGLVQLIMKPGLWFWGIKTGSSDAEIRDGCKAMLENELVGMMSQISV